MASATPPSSPGTYRLCAQTDSKLDIPHKFTFWCTWRPRDSTLVAAALINTDCLEITQWFFEFCHHVISDEGVLLHKYNPDGSLASSWHGWYHGNERTLPVQKDETALVLWAMWRHGRTSPSLYQRAPINQSPNVEPCHLGDDRQRIHQQVPEFL